MDSSGRLTSNHSKMCDIFSTHFHNLFNSSNLRGIESCLQTMKSCVTDEQNRSLTTNFTEQEIRDALFMTNPLRAPKPDGFLAWFYQKH